MKEIRLSFIAFWVILCCLGCKTKQQSIVVNDDLSTQVATIPDSLVAPLPTPTLLHEHLTHLLDTASVLHQMDLSISVYDITADKLLFASGAHQRMRPASSEKVMTAIAALEVLGEDYQFKTRVLKDASVVAGVLQGNLYVVGRMDPLLTDKDVMRMATAIKQQDIKKIAGKIYFDASMKDTLELGWGWCWDDDNPSLSPLLCNGKPMLQASFLSALKMQGIVFDTTQVVKSYHSLVNNSFQEITCVNRPLKDVLKPMMKMSDNLCAEAVFYQMGKSRKAVSEVIATTMQHAGVQIDEVLVADGSGLSLYNYQTADAFTKMLTYASRSEKLLPLLWETLPIAAVDGTLKNRFKHTNVVSNLRAKTGSVTGVFSLVGYIQPQHNNHLLAFAILTNGAKKGAISRGLQDEICKIIYSSAPF